MTELFSMTSLAGVVSTIVYSLLGLILFMVALVVMEWLSPFSIRKEIIDEHNVALGVVIGAYFVAMGLIIGAVIGS
jgi:putative membrane protein